MQQSLLSGIDDASLDRLYDGLLHVIPGDTSFLTNLSVLGRALIDFERRSRSRMPPADSTHPEPSQPQGKASGGASAKHA